MCANVNDQWSAYEFLPSGSSYGPPPFWLAAGLPPNVTAWVPPTLSHVPFPSTFPPYAVWQISNYDEAMTGSKHTVNSLRRTCSLLRPVASGCCFPDSILHEVFSIERGISASKIIVPDDHAGCPLIWVGLFSTLSRK